MTQQRLKDMTRSDLKCWMEALGEKPFRADQIFAWLYKPGVFALPDMKNLGRSLLETLLEETGTEDLMTLSHLLTSRSKDGTQKFLFRAGSAAIETVFMKYRYGNSVCVSSQAGCRMACRFCASGLKGLTRNLTAGEMTDQVLLAQALTGEPVSHVVVMGTGEPMDNLDNLMYFIEILTDPKGLGISRRRVTVSTCGLIPGMERFWRAFPQVGLAISLHGPDDQIRNQLIPAGKSAGVQDLVHAARAYARETGRRLTFEYALIGGVNDSPAQADQLAQLLAGTGCHVNLIPWNPVAEIDLKPSAPGRAAAFMERLEKGRINVTLRRALGPDIAAACGQLRMQDAAGASPDGAFFPEQRQDRLPED